MFRARHTFAATLIVVGVSSAFAQTQAPPMTSVLAGKKFTPPIKGQADIEYTKPVTKRDPNRKDMIITTVTVKNISSAPIPRLTIDETWFDKNQQLVTGGKGMINGLLQPGEIKTVTIETKYDQRMQANSWTFSHANGPVKPHSVKSLDDPNAKKEPAAKNASATKAGTKKKK